MSRPRGEDGCSADAVLPEVRGLKGPLSCLSEARYGIVWAASAPRGRRSTPPGAMPSGASSSAARSPAAFR
jgi:hypothetical protein